MNILMAASEAYPIVKTGGLGDVIYSLPRALKKQGLDVRVILPAYRIVLEQMTEMRVVGWMDAQGTEGIHNVRILETSDNHLGVPLLLVDVASLFDRPGNPYVHPEGYNWHDNAERFTVFSRAVAQFAMNEELHMGWKPDVVHCHDWQTGLVPAMLTQGENPPKSVFTIHNLSYSGTFSHDDFARLHLPVEWWSSHAMEFYGNFSMLKAGVVFAGEVTTVSPTYSREIRTPGFGYGFDGVMRSVGHKLNGILNGIDQDVWNPEVDSYIPVNYSLNRSYLKGKLANKQALLADLGAKTDETALRAPLLGLIGRLVEQKGIDLLLGILPQVLDRSDASIVILGSGEQLFEQALSDLVARYPDRLFLTLGYSEELAHRIEAGADMFLMPSRFEPCGLNQLYSLRYGTPPIVHHVGGLADTVVDATKDNIANKTATGFVFYEPTSTALLGAIERALALFQQEKTWRQLIRTGMQQDFGWERSAVNYISHYSKLIEAE